MSLKYNEVDFKQLKFSKHQNNKCGLRFLKVYYNKDPLVMRLPTMKIPFDVRMDNFGKYTVNLIAKDPKVQEVYRKLDKEMLQHILDNEWFMREFNYLPTLVENPNKSYPPTIKFKLPIKDGLIDTVKQDGELVPALVFLDKDNNKINVTTADEVTALLVKGTNIRVILECVGVWLNSDGDQERGGLTWKAVKIKIMDDINKFEETNDIDESDMHLLGE